MDFSTVTQSHRFSWRNTVGISVLFVQIVMIVAARFTESKYFCWAPHDSQNEFTITRVVINGKELSPEEIVKRYRIRTGRDPRSIAHKKNVVMQYERTYGRDDSADVTMEYKTNGILQPAWHWTHP